ncbi:hypothetical protein LZC95_40330 [Pendulispora brunnea]|uniref:DUF4351 domain-containing protein n=1 Tax=Pendulispora brunnea TaxID=2905690 RepID=A0ABZ2K1S1_9BACT
MGAASLSVEHEGLVLLFRNRPTLAAECLRDLLGCPVPEFASVESVDTQVAQVVAANRAPDLILVLRDEAGRPRLVLIVEMQRGVDRKKERSWPLYITAEAAKYDCDAMLLVVAIQETVATWAQGPFPTGHAGFSLQPHVLGPSAIPLIDDPVQAANAPELAVLSTMTHVKRKPTEDAALLAGAILGVCRQLDEERASVYSDLIIASMSEAARAHLESLMASGNYVFQSDWVKRNIALGKAEGLAEGEAKGEARALFAILEARKIPVHDEARARIAATMDLQVLERWIRRAVSVTSVDELFHD